MIDDRDNHPVPGDRPGQFRLIARALRLRCPACGQAKMFHGLLAMEEACPICGRSFRRGPGYLLGSIYFNYGVTALLVTAMYFAGFFSEAFTSNQLLYGLTLFAILFPIWFFRYARALWISFDERWDPWPNEEEQAQIERQSNL
ncbi:MAG TPA: DUF983 domain-containing protein [Lacipirellulaceae bacterium]|jgi:uncharacterized protein (DUF983 family)